MNSPCVCQKNRRACDDDRHRKRWFIRVKRVAGLIVPSTLLTLLPKCPMCFAAYVAVATGITMSHGSARILVRTLTVLCALCVATLGLCVARRLVNCSSKIQTINFQPTQAR
jgi:hypothetical protein